MKPFLLTLFLLGAVCCYAQDVIKLSGSDPVNCKILSFDKDEIVFIRNGTRRKVNTSYVEYYKFNESVKEKIYADSITTARTMPDTSIADPVKSPKTETSLTTPSLQSAGDDLVDAGRHYRSGLTLSLLGSVAMAISPFAVTTKEVDAEISSGGITYKYKVTEVNYTGMQVLMGAGVILNVIGIVELFAASSDLESAGHKMKNKQGLSFNGSLQGVNISYRF